MNLLHQEVAFVSMNVHWTYEEIMGMEHAERRRWVREILEMTRREQRPLAP